MGWRPEAGVVFSKTTRAGSSFLRRLAPKEKASVVLEVQYDSMMSCIGYCSIQSCSRPHLSP